MQDILVPTRHARSWSPAVQYAARLAALLDGSLTAVYNVPPPIAITDVALPGLAAEIIDIARDEAEAASNAQVPFERWARETGVRSSAWRVAQGSELAVLQSASKWNDLIVLARASEQDQATSVGELSQVILHVDVPCIIVPQAVVMPRLGTIAIAWKGTVESIQALHAALPLLRRAERIVLIHGEQGVTSSESDSSAAQAQQHLQAQGLTATLRSIDPTPTTAGEEILAAAIEASSDLLVMGAYGRTRLSEWAFGGATRHVLEFATIPVFMRH